MNLNRIDYEELEAILFHLGQRDQRAAEGLELLNKAREGILTDEELDLVSEEWGGDDALEIEQFGTASRADEGFWAQAWVWVRYPMEEPN